MVKYRKVQCPYCPPGAEHARRSGTYRVIETKNFIILLCTKCSKSQKMLRKHFIMMNQDGLEQMKKIIGEGEWTKR